MPTRPTRVLAGVALAALAAAGATAAANHRRGHRPDPAECGRLDELDARLAALQEADHDSPRDQVGRVFSRLHRNRGISVEHLRAWVIGVRDGCLTTEQAIAAESDFEALEREADQRGV